jgi:TonB family protein
MLIRWALPALLTVVLCCGQAIKQTSVPLGDALDHALQHGSLFGNNPRAFHIKVHVFESTNAESEYRAEIEEYWVSELRWRRTIDSPDFKQTIVTSDGQLGEDDRGDYYPLWLKGIITALFDPVPEKEHWNQLGALITQITLPNGMRSDACAREKFRIGSDTVKNDAFSNICLDSEGLLKFVGSPGYGVEFHDYHKFGKRMVPRTLREDPEPGTTIMANLVLLEELQRPDPSLFSVAQLTPAGERIKSVVVPQNVIETSVIAGAPMVWPAVQSGKTAGLLSMYVSVDKMGNVREAYPLNSDNAGLQDAARDQLLKWKVKPVLVNGVPVQAEAALSFRFDTQSAADPEEPSRASSVTGNGAATSTGAGAIAIPQRVRVSQGVMQVMIIRKVAPTYPPEAKAARIQGSVLLNATIGKDGNVLNTEVVSGPPALVDAAVEAVTQWQFRPYLLKAQPVEVETMITINFTLQ